MTTTSQRPASVPDSPEGLSVAAGSFEDGSLPWFEPPPGVEGSNPGFGVSGVGPGSMPGSYLKITAYAQELLDCLKQLEGKWPAQVLTMQDPWIGRHALAARASRPTEDEEHRHEHNDTYHLDDHRRAATAPL